ARMETFRASRFSLIIERVVPIFDSRKYQKIRDLLDIEWLMEDRIPQQLQEQTGLSEDREPVEQFMVKKAA
ncbi:MAG: hypothetical protein ACKVZH_28625, partial [Blastocatellia bacterium]